MEAILLLQFLDGITYFCEQNLFLGWCRRSGGSLGFFLLLLLCQLVDTLHEHEDAEGNDGEVDDGLDESTVVDGGSSQFLTCDFHCRKLKFQVGEVDTADKPSDRRHDDVIDD